MYYCDKGQDKVMVWNASEKQNLQRAVPWELLHSRLRRNVKKTKKKTDQIIKNTWATWVE